MYQNDWEECKARLCSKENRILWIVIPLAMALMGVVGTYFSTLVTTDLLKPATSKIGVSVTDAGGKEAYHKKRRKFRMKKEVKLSYWYRTYLNVRLMFPDMNKRRNYRALRPRRRIRRRGIFSRMRSTSHHPKMIKMAVDIISLKSTNMFPSLPDTSAMRGAL